MQEERKRLTAKRGPLAAMRVPLHQLDQNAIERETTDCKKRPTRCHKASPFASSIKMQEKVKRLSAKRGPLAAIRLPPSPAHSKATHTTWGTDVAGYASFRSFWLCSQAIAVPLFEKYILNLPLFKSLVGIQLICRGTLLFLLLFL